ncbi:MAG: hypothetical protein AUG51_03580 [Acidobacteria bacterium 13_1_20CM_3_53_8]|nr:MAG: hypothetical protein AUG51_03580 [Acidobacteria bacterium 13_1_20CM_3_53_8]
MRLRIYSFALALPLLFLIPLLSLYETVHAQTTGRNLRGHLHDTSGATLRWILVHLFNSDGRPAGLTITDHEGAFSFQGLSQTSYTIIVAAADHDPVNRQISFAGQSNPNATMVVEINLIASHSGSVARPNFTQNIPPTARAVYDRAIKIGQAGRRDVALTLMQEAVKIYPGYFDAHFALGNEFMKAGRLDEAISEFNMALKINPNGDQAYQSLGLVLMRQRKFTVAAALFAEAARLNPTEPLDPLLRAIVLLNYAYALTSSQSVGASAETNSAISEADTALARADNLSHSQLAAIHLHRARLYKLKGEKQRAANELEQYLQQNPNDESADSIRAEINRLRTPASESAPL